MQSFVIYVNIFVLLCTIYFISIIDKNTFVSFFPSFLKYDICLIYVVAFQYMFIQIQLLKGRRAVRLNALCIIYTDVIVRFNK